MKTEKIVKYGHVTISLYPRTLRRREISRQITQKINEAGFTSSTISEFAAVVAHTKVVDGGWQPPSPLAAKAELLSALDEWLDEVPTGLADAWLNRIFETDGEQETSPAASGSADPK